jgi:hypothetical protein
LSIETTNTVTMMMAKAIVRAVDDLGLRGLLPLD